MAYPGSLPEDAGMRVIEATDIELHGNTPPPLTVETPDLSHADFYNNVISSILDRVDPTGKTLHPTKTEDTTARPNPE